MRGLMCELDNACYEVPAKKFSQQEFGNFAVNSIEYISKNDILISGLSILEFYQVADSKRLEAEKMSRKSL
jgi:hypothetical protein